MKARGRRMRKGRGGEMKRERERWKKGGRAGGREEEGMAAQ